MAERRIAVPVIVAATILAVVMAALGGVGGGRAAAETGAPRAAGPQLVITETITLGAAKDNTLYESELGTVSNGAGQHLFAGTTNNGDARRAVLAFDVADSLPPGATVLAAELRLTMSRSQGGTSAVSVHALGRDWGEGASDAVGEEGAGATATAGDATWLFTFFNTSSWTQPGGDFDAAPLATTVVGNGATTWTSAALAADVQVALDNPAAHFGWILIGDEGANGTARRFDSREHPTLANRPRLVITYTAEVERAFVPVVMR